MCPNFDNKDRQERHINKPFFFCFAEVAKVFKGKAPQNNTYQTVFWENSAENIWLKLWFQNNSHRIYIYLRLFLYWLLVIWKKHQRCLSKYQLLRLLLLFDLQNLLSNIVRHLFHQVFIVNLPWKDWLSYWSSSNNSARKKVLVLYFWHSFLTLSSLFNDLPVMISFFG